MSALISKMDFALNAADRGFVPFPMGMNSAEPAFPEGDAMATKSKVMLRHWWDENPKYNVGLSLENLLTLRITERCPPATAAQLASLFQEHNAPESVCTRRARPDGGIEIYLHFSLPEGVAVEAKTDVFFAGIDLLSNDDFVVGPGSVLDGYTCTFVDDKSLSQASPWLIEMCGVELPAESKTMNVIALKRPASPSAPKVALKTKKDWAKEGARAAAFLYSRFAVTLIPVPTPLPNSVRPQPRRQKLRSLPTGKTLPHRIRARSMSGGINGQTPTSAVLRNLSLRSMSIRVTAAATHSPFWKPWRVFRTRR
jgi:Bifunctional DNA primase/polymerase, N-terminal